jgi:hypothetical protein
MIQPKKALPKKFNALRTAAALSGCACLLLVQIFAVLGVKNGFSDGLLLMMKVIGGLGVVCLFCGAILALWRLKERF